MNEEQKAAIEERRRLHAFPAAMLDEAISLGMTTDWHGEPVFASDPEPNTWMDRIEERALEWFPGTDRDSERKRNEAYYAARRRVWDYASDMRTPEMLEQYVKQVQASARERANREYDYWISQELEEGETEADRERFAAEQAKAVYDATLKEGLGDGLD